MNHKSLVALIAPLMMLAFAVGWGILFTEEPVRSADIPAPAVNEESEGNPSGCGLIPANARCVAQWAVRRVVRNVCAWVGAADVLHQAVTGRAVQPVRPIMGRQWSGGLGEPVYICQQYEVLQRYIVGWAVEHLFQPVFGQVCTYTPAGPLCVRVPESSR